MTERILVVEDNRDLAENLSELLDDHGITLTICADAEAAEREANQHGFDLAIVDIGLSGKLSGLDLLPRLRRASAHGEVVLMTGNATLNSAIEAIRSGVYAYITKPLEPDQFTTLVKRALAQVALKRDKHALTLRALASESLYRGMVENAEACILGVDEEGMIRLSSRFASERLGLSSSQLLGSSFLELCRPADLRGAFERALSGESVRDQECIHQTPLGLRTIRWALRPLPAVAPDPRHGEARTRAPRILAVGMDISDRLDLERKNAEAEAMAVMGTLTTSLAHEIRNPLNAATLQLELLLRRAKKADPEVQRQLAEPAALVRTELSRLSALLDDFLNLARPRGLAKQRCTVEELLNAVYVLKEPLARSLGIALTVGPPPANLTVQADPDRIKQVLINLVGNAIEAMSDDVPRAGRVELSAERTPGGVLIAVRDNGPGVPAAIAGSAFKPFVTSKQGGTGLGLAIVYKIVAQHGGEVRLVPRAEGGTSAELVIPG